MTSDILSILEQARSDHILPGAVVGILDNNQSELVAFGNHTYDKDSIPVTDRTVYDVASITKAIPLALLVNQALQEGLLKLDTKLVDVLGDFSGRFHDQVTIKHLLTYTVIWDFPDGLSAISHQGADMLIHEIKSRNLLYKPGQKYFYTNTPALILGWIIEKMYKKPFYERAQKEILEPLLMNSSTFYPSQTRTLAPPTELNNSVLIQNVVHDESARILQQAGYQPAHAGLFSTAADLLNCCQMLLDNGKFNDKQLLNASTVEQMLSNQLEPSVGSAGLGWETTDSIFRNGEFSKQGVYGKTGFVGCLVLLEPATKKALVMLSNASYPNRSTTRQQLGQVRAALAALLFSAGEE